MGHHHSATPPHCHFHQHTPGHIPAHTLHPHLSFTSHSFFHSVHRIHTPTHCTSPPLLFALVPSQNPPPPSPDILGSLPVCDTNRIQSHSATPSPTPHPLPPPHSPHPPPALYSFHTTEFMCIGSLYPHTHHACACICFGHCVVWACPDYQVTLFLCTKTPTTTTILTPLHQTLLLLLLLCISI